jgi:hypothetical protein
MLAIYRLQESSVKREVLYKILLEFDISKKVVHVGKLLSDKFPIQNGLKQRDAQSLLLFNFALKCAIRKV